MHGCMALATLMADMVPLAKWNENGFMALKSLLPYENAWERIFDHGTKA